MNWEHLSDDELESRLIQRGIDEALAHRAVEQREYERAQVLIERVLGAE